MNAQPIRRQRIVVARYIQVCSTQHGLHIVEQVTEERPVRRHARQNLFAVKLQRGLHTAAKAKPPRQHVPALRPREHPGNRPQ